MSVRDFMSRDLITIAPETKIFDAVDMMRQHDIHRLPVVDGDHLIGLITEGVIQAALPSQATSLSVYEVNYLLNKTTVADVMIKEVQTIAPDALLEDAIYQMRQHNIGVLPVIEQGLLVGIITNNDIFDAFLKITGYHMDGTRVTLCIKEDHTGVLAALTALLAEHELSIITIVVDRKELETIVELQLASRQEELIKEILEGAGYFVVQVVRTSQEN